MNSNPPDDLLARGGGNATASGVGFQASLGAWFVCQLLAERPLYARLMGKRLRSLRFETEAPVDDILVETDDGWIFVQAKTSLRLSDNPKSELAKTAKQFVRQWLACSNGDGDRGWNRPLLPDRNRIVLALGPSASRRLSVDLAQGLSALQMSSSAPLPKSKETAVWKFSRLLERSWETLTGQPATNSIIQAILNLITILTFNFDGADRQTATEVLSRVLATPEQAGPTFSTIAQYCEDLMKQRTGCDMLQVRSDLVAAGVQLAAPPSYQTDVVNLRAYSEHVRRTLCDYEETKVADSQIRIERQCTDAVVKAARAGSLLLIGEPGAGKSAVINASATKLRDEGHDVLELAVDRLPVQSLPELATELGLSHPLREVLLNWPGDQPAFLFIDALDATRGGENEVVFRTLMADVLSIGTRKWHVIASIRTFDLRLGEQFRRLFAGQPPNEEFADTAFPDVVHIHVPPWTQAEFDNLLQDAPMLKTAMAAGGERLRELALVPFNTRLLADLISGGLDPNAFSEIQSQGQLLGLYWNNRLTKHGTGAELCVEAAVSQMVEARSLRARKLDAARPDASALDALLHENVLIQLKQEQFIAFRHHILFDYAASRIYLRADDLDKTANLLTHSNGIGLMLAPALGFALQLLWDEAEGDHRRFWEAITRFSGDPACDPVARSVAARIASELPRVHGDAISLLEGLQVQGEAKKRSVTALNHVVGALVVRFDDKQSVYIDPWCELADRASKCIEDTVWPLRTLLYALYERISAHIHLAQLGRAARKLLAFSLDSSKAVTQRVLSASVHEK